MNFLRVAVLSSIFLICTVTLKASHYAGGEMHLRILPGDTLEVRMILYRGMESISFPSGMTFYVLNENDTLPASQYTGQRVSLDTLYFIPTGGGRGTGLERHDFVKRVKLDKSGTFKVYSPPLNARPGSVNMSYVSLYFEAKINHQLGNTNSGVRFVSSPVATSNSENLRMSNLAISQGADSVTHEMTINKSSSTSNILATPFFTNAQNPLNVNPILNKYTGLYTSKGFNPMPGRYFYAIKATAYKNGRILAETTRDVCYVPSYDAINDSVSLVKKPTFNFYNGLDSGFVVMVGDTLTLDSLLFFHSKFLGNNVYTSQFSSSADVNTSNSQSTLTTLGTNTNASFSFYPDASLSNTYQSINYRLFINERPYDYSFWIYVDGDTLVQQNGAEFHVTVNPAKEAKVTLDLYHYNDQVLPDTKMVSIINPANGVVDQLNLVKDSSQTITLKPRVLIKSTYTGVSVPLALGTYSVVLEECCRAQGILNYSVATDLPYYTSALFEVENTATSTPKFLQKPITAIAKDSLWFYDVSCNDADGDSIFYSFTDVLSAANTPVNGFSQLPGNGLLHAQIVQQAGILLLNANSTGTFAYNVTADAYQGGVLKETVNRELILEVLDSSSLVLKRPAADTITLSGIPSFNLTAGVPFSFNLDAYTRLNPDSISGLTLSAGGQVFTLPNSNATFNVTLNKQMASGKRGTFSWTPDNSLKGQKFVVNIRVSDGQMTYDYAVVLNVDKAIGVEENILHNVQVFPNPAKGYLNIRISNKDNYVVRMLGLTGQQLHQQTFNQNGGILRFDLPNEVSNGTYILQISGSTGTYNQVFHVIRQ